MRPSRDTLQMGVFAFAIFAILAGIVAWEIAVYNDCRASGMGRMTCWRIVTAR